MTPHIIPTAVTSIEEAAAALTRLQLPCNHDTVYYTAIIGGYDTLIDPRFDDPSVRFVCFTDNRSLRSDVWKIVYVDFIYRDPRRTARVFKCLPHLLFPNQVMSIWLDGNFEVTSTFTSLVEKECSGGMMFFRHSARQCVYAEAREVLRMEKDVPKLVEAQMNDYRKEGMPAGFGLFATGVLVRRHAESEVADMSQEWLRQIDRYSVRDQLSLPYILWKRNMAYNVFRSTMTTTPGLRYKAHAKWRFYDERGRRRRSLKTFLSGVYYRMRS